MIRAPEDDPTNAKVVSREGAKPFAVDAETQTMYYVRNGNQIVKDSMVGDSEPEVLVDDIQMVGDVIYDAR